MIVSECDANLESERLWRVVDDDRARQVTAEDAQILYVVTSNAATVLTKEPAPYQTPAWIKQTH